MLLEGITCKGYTLLNEIMAFDIVPVPFGDEGDTIVETFNFRNLSGDVGTLTLRSQHTDPETGERWPSDNDVLDIKIWSGGAVVKNISGPYINEGRTSTHRSVAA